MAKKLTTAKRADKEIQVATAMVIQGKMVTKYGVGYRIADIVNKVRELTGNMMLTQQTWLAAIKAWLDKNLARFNNRYLMPTAKGLPKLAKLVPA